MEQPRQRQRVARVRGARMVADDEDAIEDATTFKRRKGQMKPRKPKDQRDKLLYEVREVTPPPRRLGTFRLEPSLACGDIMQHKDRTYVIKKVSYLYNFVGGAYRMTGKGAHVKETSREAIENSLARMMPDEDEGAPPDGALVAGLSDVAPPPEAASSDDDATGSAEGSAD